MYFVYIIECADASLYTGITTDLHAAWMSIKTASGAITRAHAGR